MVKVKRTFWLGVILLGLVGRFYGIGTIPPHLSNDEISIAYDSYSLGRNGKDEHNTPIPYPLSLMVLIRPRFMLIP